MKIIRNIISYILIFLLMISLLGTVFAAELCTLTGNRTVYRNIACSGRITEKQLDSIEKKITGLADKYRFDPETVSALITPEGLHEYASQCVDWWMDALNGTQGTEVPTWPYEEIMAAVREDTGFADNVAKYEQRSVARDKIAVPLANTVTAGILCVRPELVGPLTEKVNEKIDLNMIGRLLRCAPWIFGLTAMLLAGLVILTASPGRGCRRTGYAFAGCIPVITVFLIILKTAGLPETVAESSAILAEQASSFVNGIVLRIGAAGFICLAFYFILSLKGTKIIAKACKDHRGK